MDYISYLVPSKRYHSWCTLEWYLSSSVHQAHPEGMLKQRQLGLTPEFLIEEVLAGSWECTFLIGSQEGPELAFLTHSQAMMIWWVQRPYLREPPLWRSQNGPENPLYASCYIVNSKRSELLPLKEDQAQRHQGAAQMKILSQKGSPGPTATLAAHKQGLSVRAPILPLLFPPPVSQVDPSECPLWASSKEWQSGWMKGTYMKQE